MSVIGSFLVKVWTSALLTFGTFLLTLERLEVTSLLVCGSWSECISDPNFNPASFSNPVSFSLPIFSLSGISESEEEQYGRKNVPLAGKEEEEEEEEGWTEALFLESVRLDGRKKEEQ